MPEVNALNCDCTEWELECQHAKGNIARRQERLAYEAEAYLHPLDFRPSLQPDDWKEYFYIGEREPRSEDQKYNPHKAKG